MIRILRMLRMVEWISRKEGRKDIKDGRMDVKEGRKDGY